jgi:hypothetical protein
VITIVRNTVHQVRLRRLPADLTLSFAPGAHCPLVGFLPTLPLHHPFLPRAQSLVIQANSECMNEIES